MTTKNREERKFWTLERLFASIFLVFGITLALLVPPGWNNDEREHIYRAQQLSTGQLAAQAYIFAGNKAIGGYVPESLVMLLNDTKAQDLSSRKAQSFDQNAHLAQPDNGRTTRQQFANTALYSPIAYIPQVAAFWLGHDLGYFWIIILGRILGVLMVTTAAYYSIKHIKVGKWILFAIALLPSFTMQAATFGADAMALALSVIFVTCIVNLLFAKAIAWRHAAGLTAVAIALAMVKSAYMPFLLLLPALPFMNKDLRSWRHWLKLSIPLIGSIAAGLWWISATHYIEVVSYAANREVQQNFVLAQPGMYLITLFYTFVTNLQIGMYGSLVGSYVWNTAPLSPLFAYLAVGAVLASVFVTDKREQLRGLKQRIATRLRGLRWAAFLVGTTTILLTVTAVYVYFTPPYRTSIDGVQGRYFLPLLPLLLIGLYGNTLKNQITAKRFIVLAVLVAQMGGIITLYMRLYESVPKFY